MSGNMKTEKEYGLIYVLTNRYMPGLVKIGKTAKKDVADRLKALYYGQSGVPYNFECAYAYKFPIEMLDSIEKELHKHFHDKRINTHREFFSVTPEEVDKLFWAYKQMQGYKDATEDVQKVINKVTEADEILHKRPPLDFFTLGLKIGDILVFKNDSDIQCSVASNKKVNFGSQKGVSLTRITTELLNRKHNVQPTPYWIVKKSNRNLSDLYNDAFPLKD